MSLAPQTPHAFLRGDRGNLFACRFETRLQSLCNRDFKAKRRQLLQMTDSIVDRYIRELKRHFKVTSDDDLSRKVNIGKSTLASWRRRGAIPADFCGAMLHDERIDYFKLVRDHVAEAISMSAAGEKMLLSAAISLGRQLDDAPARDWASWIADNRLRIFQEIVKLDEAERIDEAINDQYVASRVVGLVMRTANGNLLTAAELKRIRREVRARLIR
ncbi:MAG: bacteriophage CI repressor [Mesorhizobium sp.]|nr:MAG: bacteriophage CI repressor [Mesorhizobium sp.]